jgi:hypothetical protein
MNSKEVFTLARIRTRLALFQRHTTMTDNVRHHLIRASIEIEDAYRLVSHNVPLSLHQPKAQARKPITFPNQRKVQQ